MSAFASALPPATPRKPPASAQLNWITGEYESAPEQLALDLPETDEAVLPDDGAVSLLTTENGAQLFIAGFGLFAGKKGERIVVRRGKAVCAEAPLFRLQEVVIGSTGVSFSSDLVRELCSRGIRLSCLEGSGKPFALLTSPLLTATVETRRAQFAAYHDERGASLCRWIVAGKLHNQEKLLRYFSKSRTGERREQLERAADAIRRLRKGAHGIEGASAEAVRGSLLGLEGTAGRLYWAQVGEMLPEEAGFGGRQHSGAPDAVNAALNYGYGILYSHVWGAAMNAGLEPFAGFLHVDRSGKPSMVLDLVEEFRQPVVDRPILSWLNKGGRLAMWKGLLDGQSRENVASRVLLRLNAVEAHRGKEHQVRSIIQMQARLAASAVRGRRDYRPFLFRW
jgi:CRISPR-associated protein Cas1